MAETAKVIAMPVPMGERKPYPINWRGVTGDHPEVRISVSLQDSVHWTCNDRKFRVLKVDATDKNPEAPQPFYRRFPEDNREFAYQVNSGPARPEAGKDYEYKAHFEFDDGTTLDPHIQIGP